MAIKATRANMLKMIAEKKAWMRKHGIKQIRYKPAKANKSRQIRLIRSVINRELETKYVATTNPSVNFNSTISTWGEMYSALPSLPQTNNPSDPSSRINSQVTPMDAKLDLTVGIGAINRTVAIKVDVFVLTRKPNRYYPDTQALAGSPQLLLTGVPGTNTTNYTGTLTNRVFRINYDEFTVLHKRTFILGGNVGLPNGDTTAGNAPNLPSGCMSRSFTFHLKAPKTLKYNENTASINALYPNNYAPFFCVGYCKLDGTAPDVTYQALSCSWTASMTFNDA